MRGPSVVKTRGPSLVSTGHPRVRGTDARWRALFEQADAVSEGSARTEGGARIWYGTTSLILPLPASTEAERAYLSAFCASDLHVRLRAVRIARREAMSRAPASLDRTTCEIRVSADVRGVRIDVDIQAPLIEGSLGTVRRR